MRSLLRLIPYVRRYAWAYGFSFVAMIVARFLEGLIPYFVKIGIDGIADGQKAIGSGQIDVGAAVQTLTYPAIAIAVCVAVQVVVVYVYRAMQRRIGINAGFDLRNRLYQHLQLQGPVFYSRYGIGDLMARAINDLNLTREILAGTIRYTVVLLMTALTGLFFMFTLAPKLALAVLLPMPIVSLVAQRYSLRIYSLSNLVQEGFSELSTFVQENLNGIRTVQAMAQEVEEVRRFDRVNQDFATRNLTLFTTTSFLNALMPILAASGSLIIISYGSRLLAAGEITIGTFSAFFAYLGLLLWPVREVGSVVTQWQRGASGTTRLFEILDYPPEIQDRAQGEFPELTGQVTIRNLSYRYEGKDKYALQDIDLEIGRGEAIAIIGPVGCGKSTLLRLLVRLLDPSEGEILLDGHPITGFPLAHLRSRVCLVLQDPFLFADSLGDNIAYDDPTRDHSQIMEVAHAAALEETIEGFPDGLNTILGERGVTLSGGQKQRTALARGLIRHTPLLILDDCFSAVDTETEERILTELKRVRRDLSTIIVSNRVSTARHADRIVVLDEGRMIEVGTHDALLARGGYYAQLERSQRSRRELAERLDARNRATAS